ncbi:fatty acid--CoA ligase [Sphingomonas jatrophae]|uniref:3-methylmercaptopropionyl-CoA ligase n=1 Tax=Sphingomonas jatrophae TaxID=1166337 RepID=A0A1I6M4J1_9SPHN|nr:fatty acid--CoA ligase [Sphingomonas jatrophae]SFS10452.1 long-chain acyl-CoA synthetase [Sphingomonas jatrophae]
MSDEPTLGALIRAQGARYGDKTALRFEGADTSYAALDARASRVANGLIAQGIRPGERIGYLGKNHPAYYELLFGAAKAGAVMVPVNWRLADAELDWIIRDAQVRWIVAGPDFAGRLAALFAGRADAPTLLPLTDYPAWRDGQPDNDPDVAVDAGDVAVQLYTSGTTGRPKGAMLSHRNLLVYRTLPVDAQPAWNRFTDDDVSLIVMPVFHIGGTGFGTQTLAAGATGLVVAEFDAGQVLDFIEHERLSKIFVVPSALQMLLGHPRAREVDYGRIRTILYGASPIPLPLLREAMAVFRCGFVQMYGMTETSGTVCALTPEDHDPAGTVRMTSAGRPMMPGVEIRIQDAAGTPLPTGQSGEIAIRAPLVMVGYWQRPDATAEALSPDGWFRTGDAGYLDEGGYLFIQDRVKDMIVTGGENVYPAEVEAALYEHPAIAEVAVIGVPSAKWGEEVKAVAVAKPGTAIEPAEVIAWARQRIAGYKLPKSVDVIPALPRGPTGKILRRELRAPFWEGYARNIN